MIQFILVLVVLILAWRLFKLRDRKADATMRRIESAAAAEVNARPDPDAGIITQKWVVQGLPLSIRWQFDPELRVEHEWKTGERAPSIGRPISLPRVDLQGAYVQAINGERRYVDQGLPSICTCHDRLGQPSSPHYH